MTETRIISLFTPGLILQFGVLFLFALNFIFCSSHFHQTKLLDYFKHLMNQLKALGFGLPLFLVLAEVFIHYWLRLRSACVYLHFSLRFSRLITPSFSMLICLLQLYFRNQAQ